MSLIPFTDRKYDVEALLSEAEKVIRDNPWGAPNQLCLINTLQRTDAYEGIGNVLCEGYPMFGLNENDFVRFNEKYKGGALHDLYLNFPVPITRMRLMRIQPRRCLSMHSDGTGEVRFHVALKTNPNAFFLYAGDKKLMHVPADGRIYRFEVEASHSAVNFSKDEERIHIVLNLKKG